MLLLVGAPVDIQLHRECMAPSGTGKASDLEKRQRPAECRPMSGILRDGQGPRGHAFLLRPGSTLGEGGARTKKRNSSFETRNRLSGQAIHSERTYTRMQVPFMRNRQQRPPTLTPTIVVATDIAPGDGRFPLWRHHGTGDLCSGVWRREEGKSLRGLGPQL